MVDAAPNYRQFPTRPWKDQAYKQPSNRGPELRNAPTTIPNLIADFLQWTGNEPDKGTMRQINKLDQLLDFSPHRAVDDATSAMRRGDLGQAALSSLGFLPLGGGIPRIAQKFKKKPVGSLKTVMLNRGGKRGDYPSYGIVDESDNTLVTRITGDIDPEGSYGVNIAAAHGPDTRKHAKELLDQGQITKAQFDDFFGFETPMIDKKFITGSEELLDDILKLQGISGGVGDAVRSGTAFGRSIKGIMDAAGPMVLTKPLREAKGNIEGTRVTGARSRHESPLTQQIYEDNEIISGNRLENLMQELAMPFSKSWQSIPIDRLRNRAIKQGVKPAEDLTLPTPSRFRNSRLRDTIRQLMQRGNRKSQQVQRGLDHRQANKRTQELLDIVNNFGELSNDRDALIQAYRMYQDARPYRISPYHMREHLGPKGTKVVRGEQGRQDRIQEEFENILRQNDINPSEVLLDPEIPF